MSYPFSLAALAEGVMYVAIIVLVLIVAGGLLALLTCYRKVEQGQALVKNGVGGTAVTFSGMVIFPIIHKANTWISP